MNSIGMKFRILKGGKKTKAKTVVLDFKRPHFSMFRDLFDMVLKREQVQKSCFVFD